MEFDGGDEERKARASLDQLYKLGLAKKKDFSYQGSGGRGVVYYDATMISIDSPKMDREVPEAEEALIGAEAFITGTTADDDTCPF